MSFSPLAVPSPVEPAGSSSRPLVTVIVVAHDAARRLEGTLRAVAEQSRVADRALGVDNGSRDGGGALLTRAFGAHGVLTLSRSTGFGSAVARAVRSLPPMAGGREWIWLLHDDCEPDREALNELLRAAAGEPEAAVLGPGLRDHLDRDLLLEAGVTVDRVGRRHTGLDRGEYDHGQRDGAGDVLAVSTAGMLIRRDVWDEIGGFDPGLPLFRDDLDFCWRVRNAGYKVLFVPAAVAWHAEAAARGRRPLAASRHRPRRLDRRNAMFVVLVNLPLLAMWRALARNTAWSLLRTAGLVLAKRPGSALDEISALGAVLLRPVRLLRGRRRRRIGRRARYREVKHLLAPPGAGRRRLFGALRTLVFGTDPGARAAGRAVADPATGRPSARERGNGGGEPGSGGTRGLLGSPGVPLVMALLGVTAVAARDLLGGSLLGGGALVPVAGDATDLWRLYVEDRHAAELGSEFWAPPYVAVLAGLSVLFLSDVPAAVAALLIGCVPLAGLSAYLALRFIVPSPYARFWLGATYALLPVATGAVATGRLGTAVVLTLLPVYVGLAAAMLTRDRRGSRRAAFALGLALAVGSAFVPLVYALTAALCVFAAVAFGGVRRGAGEALAIVLTVPLLLLLPWAIQLVEHPGRFLLEAGLHRPALVHPALPAESFAALSPGGPGMPPLWVTSGLVLSALAALLIRRRRMVVAIGWGVAIFGLLVSILVSRVTTTGLTGGVEAPAWPGVPLAFAAMGLATAAALMSRPVAEMRAAGGLRGVLAVAAVAAAFSTPVLAAGFWMANGVQGPLRSDVPPPFPAVAAAAAAPGDRALMVRPAPEHGGLIYTVLPGRAPLIGESDLPGTEPDVRDRVELAAAGLLSGRGDGDLAVLAEFGVRFVVLASPVDPQLIRALDTHPDLVKKSATPDATVWQSTLPVAHRDGGSAEGAVPYRWWLWAQGALALVVFLLALPGGRGRRGIVPDYDAVHTPPLAPARAGFARVGSR
ncbi:Glycosyltransferase, GT2 family [Sinosporangium album]|uniref:Glycosyltransferase, GT2 family n=1 Tax=Sinosporangium album TaxID=504805 RepID=A0A1G7VYE5_9ACTN|nr:glycosyltransferase family 2 protein [Sinosporangium album]SDG64767.1 Glycosyltransferase, GT2 family [Sinosporangium album]